jgi:hypothetical protein
MADAVRCIIARPAGIPDRSAGAASATGKDLREGGDTPLSWFTRQTKTPHQAGLLPYVVMPRSNRTAASIAPAEADGADAAARHYDDPRPLHYDRGALDDDDLGIGTASAIGAAMEAEAATTGGIRGTKACDRAGNQNQCEKIFHVISLQERRRGAR